ncbi:MAG: hypothetical protein ACFN3H_05800, partial [Spirochaetales bacterium]
MFFWSVMTPFLTYRWLLLASAIIPAVFLLVKVYRSDRLEKESPYLILGLVISGIISTFFALIAERILGTFLNRAVENGTMLYNLILYF